MTEEQVVEGEENTQTEEENQVEEEVIQPSSASKKLEEQIQNLQSQVEQLTNITTTALRPKAEESAPALTEAEIKRFQANPDKYFQEKLEHQKQVLEQTAEKLEMDKQAYETYPLLRKQGQFQNAVRSKMQELVNGREYRHDSPKLILRAAQLVAAQLDGGGAKPTQGNGAMSRVKESSEIPTNTTTRLAGSSTKIKDTDPRVQMAMAMGVTDPKSIEKFKSTLGPYSEPKRPARKTLLR